MGVMKVHILPYGTNGQWAVTVSISDEADEVVSDTFDTLGEAEKYRATLLGQMNDGPVSPYLQD